MIATRAVHFAATAMTVGSIVFESFVAMPVLRHDTTREASFRKRTRPGIWISLVVAVVSGAVWLMLQTASMSGMPLHAALSSDVLSTVVNETQFGEVTTIRAGLAICLAACLVYDRSAITRWLRLAAAIGFAGSVAWTGHAGATMGAAGYLHLCADALHAVAAAAWIGGLVSLIIFLTTSEIRNDASPVRDSVQRFSVLGIVSVAVLLLTGIVNSVILIGSLHGLVATEYGLLLMLKVAMFVLMLAFAAVNRYRLTPRLASAGNQQPSLALDQLIQNSVIETIVGTAILVIVATLGTLHPAVHLAALAPLW